MINLSSHGRLLAISVQSPPLPLERKEHIHGSDGLSLGMLSVSDSVSDHALQVVLENSSGFFVDQTTDTLDTTSSCQSSDRWFSDALNVVSQDFPVSLCASLAKSFSSFATSRHDDYLSVKLLCCVVNVEQVECCRKLCCLTRTG